MRLFLSLLFLFLGQCFSIGQDSLLIVQADDIEITSTRIPVSLYRAPFAVQKLHIDQLANSNQNFSINEYVGNLPGVFALNQYNSAQDLRISIRGFGSRSAFGIRGVKILMDGIPLSTPDGQGQVDNIFVGGIRGVEVMNGASSAVYGNASGGVLSLTTFDDSDQSRNLLTLGIGSFRELRTSLSSHFVKGRSKIDNQISYATTNGFRDHAASSNLIYNGRFQKDLMNDHQLSIILNIANSPQGNDPGGVNLEDVSANRQAARARNVDFNSGEEVTQATAGLKYKVPIGDHTSATAMAYYTIRDFNNRLPFENGGQVDLLRNYGGGSVHLEHSFSAGNWDNVLLAGVDIAYQNDLRKRFVNMQGIRGEETLNQNEIFSNQAGYVSVRSRYSRVLLVSSLRYDRNQISVKDRFEADGIAEGELALPSVSPAISVSYNIYKYHFLSASFSYGFETPTLSELSSRPDNQGGLNTDLRPQQSYNYEIGYKAIVSDDLSVTSALFAINSTDELLPYELEEFPGRTFYRNAGQTSRQGIEVAADAKISQDIRLNVAYTFSDFKFSKGDDFIGNSLPGIPKHNFSGTISYESDLWSAKYSSMLYSEFYVNSSNAAIVPSYHLGSISVSRKVGSFRPYIGINNLYNNTNYYDNIRINAFGGRFYEAGPPRNYYVGVKLEF